LHAIKHCRLYGAKPVIAKLDRLSRDAHFLLGLEKAGVDFVAADMRNANRLTVGIMASGSWRRDHGHGRGRRTAHDLGTDKSCARRRQKARHETWRLSRGSKAHASGTTGR
jgi:hypothetical protein